MEITIAGRHIKVTDALKKQIEEKLEKLQHHFDHIIKTHVIINVEKDRHLIEVTMKVNQMTICAKEESNNMYSSIELVMDKLDQQIRKHKEKIKNHRNHQSIKKED